MAATRFSPSDLETYHRDGFYLAKSLFSNDEISKLLAFAETDPAFRSSLYGRKDATGLETKLALWNEADESLYSMFSRSPRIVDRMEQILGGEVYHYHSKMMLKEPHVGGAWEWHQDYGYWYRNGVLAPLATPRPIVNTLSHSRLMPAGDWKAILRSAGSAPMRRSTFMALGVIWMPAPTSRSSDTCS